MSKHCGLVGNPDYPKLLACEQFVKAAIETCQANKKRVYISLGGATKDYGLASEEKARVFAKRVFTTIWEVCEIFLLFVLEFLEISFIEKPRKSKVKSVRIWSFSGPYFLALRLNM